MNSHKPASREGGSVTSSANSDDLKVNNEFDFLASEMLSYEYLPWTRHCALKHINMM
jgi:hypothetical protein